MRNFLFSLIVLPLFTVVTPFVSPSPALDSPPPRDNSPAPSPAPPACFIVPSTLYASPHSFRLISNSERAEITALTYQNIHIDLAYTYLKRTGEVWYRLPTTNYQPAYAYHGSLSETLLRRCLAWARTEQNPGFEQELRAAINANNLAVNSRASLPPAERLEFYPRKILPWWLRLWERLRGGDPGKIYQNLGKLREKLLSDQPGSAGYKVNQRQCRLLVFRYAALTSRRLPADKNILLGEYLPYFCQVPIK